MARKIAGEYSIVVTGLGNPLLTATGKTIMQSSLQHDMPLEVDAVMAVAQILECYRDRISWQQLQANGYKIIRVKLVEVS